jgi:cell division protein FtsX
VLRRFLDSRVLSFILLIVIVISLTTLTIVFIQWRNYTKCVAGWADDYTSRVASLAPSNDARFNTLIAFAQSLQTQNERTEQQKYKEFLDAVKKYNTETKVHPLPAPPRLKCGSSFLSLTYESDSRYGDLQDSGVRSK